MTKIFALLLFLSSLHAGANEIIDITLKDGEIIKGKLWLPSSTKSIDKLVIFIHGTGPNTFLNRRKTGTTEFDYYGYFAAEFTKRGIAFLSYNRRGVDTMTAAPYEKIDREKFKKYLPVTEADDVSCIIQKLKSNKQFKKTRIILLGWSEGSIIAPMVAENRKNNVFALLLAGYVNERMDSVINWQYSGESSILILKKYFDTNNDFTISRHEYETETVAASAGRSGILKNATFVQLDINKDSVIDKNDFGLLSQPNYKALMTAYNNLDNEWIWKNYFRVSVEWMQQHFALEANKTRMLRIKMPIFIFHGDIDANCDVNGVYTLARAFREKNKNNLQYFVFSDHDHNLNFSEWLMKKEMPKGIEKMFEVAESL